jgi:hypothetical protein
VKIVNRAKECGTSEKRFRFPCSVFDTCPKCGAEVEKDFEEDYLSYPSFNTAEDVNFYCWVRNPDPTAEDDLGCGHEWTEQIILRLTVEEAPGKDEE